MENNHNMTPSNEVWEVVLSVYDEDVSWALPIASRTHVYDKGSRYDNNNTDVISKFASWTKLPNLGREGDTYLHHIISNYDNHDKKVTVFLQGRIDDHVFGHPLNFVRTIAEQASKRSISTPPYVTPADYHFRHTTYFGKALQHSKDGCFGQWFEKYVSVPFPANGQPVPFYRNGLFAVSWQRIRARSVDYYRRIRESISSEDPENGHYLERSWVYMFSI